MKHLKAKAVQILIGEGIVTFVTIIVTLAFLESNGAEILRNIIVVDVLFLVIYVLWIKLFGSYEKMYKFGLKGE
jgi:hypothetical protein